MNQNPQCIFTPLMTLKQEVANEQYRSLYLIEPRASLSKQQELQQAAIVLKQDSEEDLFNKHILSVGNAVAQKADFICSNEFHKKCIESHKDKSKRSHLYLLLSVVSLTNSVHKIPTQIEPLSQFKEIAINNIEETLVFLKYLNNYTNQITGMEDFRDNSQEYIDFVKKIFTSPNEEVLLNSWRCLYTIMRCTTAQQLTDDFVLCVIDLWQKFEQKQQENKNYSIMFNLACGIVGRMVLTLCDEDAGRGNQTKLTIKKIAEKMQFKVAAPCVKDIQTYLNSIVVKKIEDEMF